MHLDQVEQLVKTPLALRFIGEIQPSEVIAWPRERRASTVKRKKRDAEGRIAGASKIALIEQARDDILERARAAPVPTAAVVVVSMLAYGVIPTIVTAALLPLVISLGIYSSALAQMVGALVQSVAAAYVALALSKAYNDIAYRGW